MDRCYETNMKEKPSDADDKLAEMIDTAVLAEAKEIQCPEK